MSTSQDCCEGKMKDYVYNLHRMGSHVTLSYLRITFKEKKQASRETRSRAIQVFIVVS